MPYRCLKCKTLYPSYTSSCSCGGIVVQDMTSGSTPASTYSGPPKPTPSSHFSLFGPPPSATFKPSPHSSASTFSSPSSVPSTQLKMGRQISADSSGIGNNVGAIGPFLTDGTHFYFLTAGHVVGGIGVEVSLTSTLKKIGRVIVYLEDISNDWALVKITPGIGIDPVQPVAFSGVAVLSPSSGCHSTSNSGLTAIQAHRGSPRDYQKTLFGSSSSLGSGIKPDNDLIILRCDTGPWSKPSDSGMPVWDQSNNLIGINIAGTGGGAPCYSVIMPIENILSALTGYKSGLSLCSGTSTVSLSLASSSGISASTTTTTTTTPSVSFGSLASTSTPTVSAPTGHFYVFVCMHCDKQKSGMTPPYCNCRSTPRKMFYLLKCSNPSCGRISFAGAPHGSRCLLYCGFPYQPVMQ